MTQEVKVWWETTADDFQEAVDRSPGIGWGWDELDDADLLGDVAGKDVIELGCGGGQCTVALANAGANVVGVDLSTTQLAYAEDLATEHGARIDLVQGDVSDLGVASDRFDIAFNSFVFQWIEEIGAAFAEAYRVLRPGGRFVFSTPHPMFRTVNPETHAVEHSYFDTGRWVRYEDADGEGNDLVVYHHTVADIHGALRATGFEVERLLEPGSPDPADHESGPWGDSPAELRSKVPRVLVVEARKSRECLTEKA
jgi:SAM-dependent methyltransferase